jgi:hypothetical protein
MSENASRDMPTPIPIKLIEDTARELMARAAIDFPRTIARGCGGRAPPAPTTSSNPHDSDTVVTTRASGESTLPEADQE